MKPVLGAVGWPELPSGLQDATKMGRQPRMRRFALPFILKNQVTKAEGEVESMDF